MQFSSGDYVAIGIGGVGSVKWIVELLYRWRGKEEDRDHSEEDRLTQLRSDFEVHKAEDRKDITFIKDAITEIKGDMFAMRKQITALQSQIRFVASGSNNRITELGKDHSNG